MKIYNKKTKWLDEKIGNIYAILPTYEEYERGEVDNNILESDYFKILISEIISYDDLMFNGDILKVAIKLNILKQKDNQNHKFVRKIVLDCLEIITAERELILNDVD